jgi:hypothetical protein
LDTERRPIAEITLLIRARRVDRVLVHDLAKTKKRRVERVRFGLGVS